KLLRAHIGNREPRPRDVLRGGAPRAGLSRGKPPAGRDPADSRPASGGPALRPLLVRVAHVLGLSSPWPLYRDPSGPCPYDPGVRLGRSSADSPTAAERRPACLRSLKAQVGGSIPPCGSPAAPQMRRRTMRGQDGEPQLSSETPALCNQVCEPRLQNAPGHDESSYEVGRGKQISRLLFGRIFRAGWLGAKQQSRGVQRK